MAEVEQTISIDHADMFNSALTDEAPVQEQQPEPAAPEPVAAPQDGEKPRDELGRFTKQAENADAAPIQQPPVEGQKPDEAQVPSWRLRELRERSEAAETRERDLNARYLDQQRQFEAMQRQLADLQKPKQEPVDFFNDPDAALKQRLNPLESQVQQSLSEIRLEVSTAKAIAKYGAKDVEEMEQAVEKAMRENHPDMNALSLQMRDSKDPARIAMDWYKRDKLLRETGGDVTAFKTKTLEDALKDPAFLAKALEAAKVQAGGSQTKPNIQIPPSLNRTVGAGANSGSADGDVSDAALFRDATARRR